ncbi:MAG: RNA polymerase sigma factor [Chlorobi bacterium]|nr:MAG: ECF subfamily RNA polymerase sigma-70 factor [Chlorobi bacterium OLB7]MBK8910332.1 RNA polymerase sigma factor [Chlorobiota bacterium]MBX7217264.1 RNA polymerase sigma factor [Candidatus Kapabacteria bacterium]
MSNNIAQTSDQKAREQNFLRLLLPVRNQLFRFAVALMRDYDDAMDVTAETILIALQGYDERRPEAGFKSYLFTIATRLCRRMKARRKWFISLQPETSEAIAGNAPSPDVAPDLAALREALAQLPARQREAITLFELGGLSLQEIQQIQGGSLSGVKSRIVRGRQRLAELLGATTEGCTDPAMRPSSPQRDKGAATPLLSSMQPSQSHD